MVLNTRSIPIFIHHEGNSQYLKEVINQAEEYNECVILFGDKSNDRKMGGCNEFSFESLGRIHERV